MAELLERISSAELTEWMAHKRLEEEDRQAEEAQAQTRGGRGGHHQDSV